MHAVRVGVGVTRVGVCMIVRVEVGWIGRMVGVIFFVKVIWAVSFTNETSDSWVAKKVGLILDCGRGTDPQAIKKIKITHAITRLLNTLAVYHKIHHGF